MSTWRVNEARAEGAAQELLDRHHVTTLPVCPFALAEAEDILVKPFTPVDHAFTGCLVRNGNAFGICYADHIQNEGFKRFTVSHELGHYCIPGHCLELLKDGVHYSQAAYSTTNPFEREAELFAAALLMPRVHVRRILHREGKGFGAIQALASEKHCHVSLTAAAIRYSGLSDEGTVVILSKDGKIESAFLSSILCDMTGLRWPRRGSRIPPDSATCSLADITGVHTRRSESAGCLSRWISGAPDLAITEEAVSLGSYGKILTVLSCEETIDVDAHNEPEVEEEAFENIGLPSERGYFEKRRRRR